MQTSFNMKLVSLVIFNLAIVLVGTFLLTYTVTATVTTPAGSFSSSGFYQPYSPASKDFTAGAGAVWLGLGIVWIAGNAILDGVKVPGTAESKSKKQSDPPVSETILAICPACKARIPPTTKFCPDCGTSLQKSP